MPKLIHGAFVNAIKKQQKEAMKRVAKLKRSGDNDRDVVFRLVRSIANIWQIHPFREGNTRSIIVFAVLLANWLGFDVEHELFKDNASYVRNALVWCCQVIYSKYEYLERIIYDAILHENVPEHTASPVHSGKYDVIGDYRAKDYKECFHEYSDE